MQEIGTVDKSKRNIDNTLKSSATAKKTSKNSREVTGNVKMS